MTKEISCCKCGVSFWVAERHYQQLLDKGKTFYCPNGHPQSFMESNAQRVKKLKEKLKWAEDRATNNLGLAEQQELRARSYKAHFTRLKNEKLKKEKVNA